MKRIVIPVELSTGETAHLRVQTAGEFLDMEEALAEAREAAGEKHVKRMRVAVELKLARTVCDAEGNLLAERLNGAGILSAFKWADALTLVAQVNENNGL